jgi:hypothetical protein
MRAEDMEQGDTQLFDVPAHLYRQALKHTIGWLKQSLRADDELAFGHETGLRFFCGFFRRRREDHYATGTSDTTHEMTRFVKSLIVSKLSRKV